MLWIWVFKLETAIEEGIDCDFGLIGIVDNCFSKVKSLILLSIERPFLEMGAISDFLLLTRVSKSVEVAMEVCKLWCVSIVCRRPTPGEADASQTCSRVTRTS